MKLIAHGGYSSKYPENTLESFLEAQKFNPYAIEMDVVYDPIAKVLRCYHPSGVSSESGTFNSSEVLVQTDSLSNSPMFSEVLGKLDASQKILVDLKEPSDSNLKMVMEIVSLYPVRFILGIRTLDDYLKVKDFDSRVQVLALFVDPDSYIEFAKIGGKMFRLREDDVTKLRVDHLHSLGLEAWAVPGRKASGFAPRTSGEIAEAGLLNLLAIGLDAVMVNDIEMATRVVNG